jgi:hypothetical protein
MSLAFPDVNVWLALASEEHTLRDGALAARVKSLVTPGSQAKTPAPHLQINNLRNQVGRASACRDF